jgi:hypothetical protein
MKMENQRSGAHLGLRTVSARVNFSLPTDVHDHALEGARP